MFAGGRRRSSNIRTMQLFHELKQQFPTVPDHVVSACIATHAYSNSPNKDTTIREILEAAAILSEQQELMGRNPPDAETPTLTPIHPSEPPELATTPTQQQPQRPRFEKMNDSYSDHNRHHVMNAGVQFFKKPELVRVISEQPEKPAVNNPQPVKRPNHLDIKPETCSSFRPEELQDASGRPHNIQLSEKCKDVHKLLNSVLFSDNKPPRSPLSGRRFSNAKNSPTRAVDPSTRSPEDTTKELKKKETASTPTQTTDTLLNNNSVNLSLNVNCSMDLVQSPTNKRKSILQVTPQQPWLQEPVSPRSYTSVNLTLRPPSSEPQPPIDITSQNSSLTYSTSSFDSQKGLQSRLQITVGPGGGSVSSVRTRPRSFHLAESSSKETTPVRAGSLNNLSANSDSNVIIKQQARIERLRIELRTEKAKLLAMRKDVSELEDNPHRTIEDKVDKEVENQLRMEIKHLRVQCEQLNIESDKIDTSEICYQNFHAGQRGPLHVEAPPTSLPNLRGALFSRETNQENEPPRWNCSVCTFLNHPYLDKCETCNMPRILHGNNSNFPMPISIAAGPPPDINTLHIMPSQSLPEFHNNYNPPRSSASSDRNNNNNFPHPGLMRSQTVPGPPGFNPEVYPRSVHHRPIGFVVNNHPCRHPGYPHPQYRPNL